MNRRRLGWRVHWDHPNGRDQFCGELWPDVATAEFVAETVRDGGMLNVRVLRGSEPGPPQGSSRSFPSRAESTETTVSEEEIRADQTQRIVDRLLANSLEARTKEARYFNAQLAGFIAREFSPEETPAGAFPNDRRRERMNESDTMTQDQGRRSTWRERQYGKHMSRRQRRRAFVFANRHGRKTIRILLGIERDKRRDLRKGVAP